MSTDSEKTTPSIKYPVLLTMTTILCLVSYQVFGMNTAIGVATGAAILALFAMKRNANSPAAE